MYLALYYRMCPLTKYWCEYSPIVARFDELYVSPNAHCSMHNIVVVAIVIDIAMATIGDNYI